MKLEIEYWQKSEFSIDDLFSFFSKNQLSITFLHKNLLEYCTTLVDFKGINSTGAYQTYSFENESFFVISSRKGDWYLVELHSLSKDLFNYVESIDGVFFLKLKE